MLVNLSLTCQNIKKLLNHALATVQGRSKQNLSGQAKDTTTKVNESYMYTCFGNAKFRVWLMRTGRHVSIGGCGSQYGMTSTLLACETTPSSYEAEPAVSGGRSVNSNIHVYAWRLYILADKFDINLGLR